MEAGKGVEKLFQYASKYQFEDFEKLFGELAQSGPAEPPGEAWLMRAQIKLFASDETLAQDLDKAGGATAALPCLNERWLPDSPNRLVVFNREAGALERFLAALPAAGEALGRRYGGEGSGMVRQIQSEALYYRGDFAGALALAGEQGRGGRPTDTMMALYVRFRCCLATGDLPGAEQSMLGMIQTSMAHPECVGLYHVVRNWSNLTTGWSGDTPRFQAGVEGEPLPVLDDRLIAIRQGISRLGETEQPFADYAAQSYQGACTMRQHYMDIFHALHWHHAQDHQQAAAYFEEAYKVSTATGLVMPFVEYGRQIIPLLRGAQKAGLPCAPAWLDKVTGLAEQYEKNLETYRSL